MNLSDGQREILHELDRDGRDMFEPTEGWDADIDLYADFETIGDEAQAEVEPSAGDDEFLF